MNTTTFLLLMLLAVCALAMATLGVLWLRGREERRESERLLTEKLRLLRTTTESEREVTSKYKKTIDTLEKLRLTSEKQAESDSRLIGEWQQRYLRIAHWESVEDFAAKERELQQSTAALEQTVEALRNVIDGYGSRYVVPPQTVLDELAREYAHTSPGEGLKAAREWSRKIAREGVAATSDYANSSRSELAANFALDAFNGKVEAILSSVKLDNVGTLRQRIKDAFTIVNQQGSAFGNSRISDAYFSARMKELEWAALVQQHRQDAKEEQRLLKERMREEAKVQREIERVQRETEKREQALQREREVLEKARVQAAKEQLAMYEARLQEELEKATESERATVETEFRARMAEQEAVQRAEYETRIAEQDARLAAILAERERSKSMAQQTKRGTVYVISNVGSFGERVFKIGQTRRLDPMDRIWELGDASVPFDFDVHALIKTEDAPRLESALHEQFLLEQINKMNWRKEFFRVELGRIRQTVEDMGLEAEWTMTARAQQFHETRALEHQLALDPLFRTQWLKAQSDVSFELQESSVFNEAEEDNP